MKLKLFKFSRTPAKGEGTDETSDKGKSVESSSFLRLRLRRKSSGNVEETAHSESSSGKQSRRNSVLSMTSVDYDKKSSFMVDPLTGVYLDDDDLIGDDEKKRNDKRKK